MTRGHLRRVASLVLATTGLSVALSAGAPANADSRRTVYFSAFDSRGAYVTDLGPSDVIVSENGQTREIISLSQATEPLHIAVLVDDGGSGTLQAPVEALVGAVTSGARLSISLLSPQPFRLTDYSATPDTLQRAVAKIVQRGRIPPDLVQLPEAVSWAAREQKKRQLSRPVIVALTLLGEAGTKDIARDILDDLRASGASLHVVYVSGAPLGQVLMDGPQLSGGSSRLANSTSAFVSAVTSIKDTLTHQYLVTYGVPSDAKGNSRLQLTTTRANVKIVAPSQVPGK